MLTNKQKKILIKMVKEEIEIYNQLPKKVLEGSKTADHIAELQFIKTILSDSDHWVSLERGEYVEKR